MGYYRILVLMVLVNFLCQGLNYCQQKEATLKQADTLEVVSKHTNEEIEINYLAGVKTPNLGLKVSSAYYLGERKSERSVIPLMNMLHTDPSPEARIIAALSLYKIADERGLWAIKRAAEFEENEHVKKICNILYEMHILESRTVTE